MGTKNNPGDFDCYDNAAPDEPMFILLARDTRAPDLVRLWAAISAGDIISADAAYKNLTLVGKRSLPEKVTEARDCANAMEEWHRKNN